MKFNLLHKYVIIGMFFLGALIMYFYSMQTVTTFPRKHWNFQSIDTMKYSRDRAREMFSDPKYANQVEVQVSNIANTGASYMAIDTPYDDEFKPVLALWVRTARKHNLRIWFRGNFAGWEQWFGYAQIDQKTHTEKTQAFIRKNASLFEDGDIFSACPECENGQHLATGNINEVIAYRRFLISNYQASKAAFKEINKNVASNFYSMNLDVAKAVMDQNTTRALDGMVVIDHYVKSPQELAQDVVNIAQLTGGNVVVGEMGAPIPDIHGPMTNEQQKKWLLDSLLLLSSIDSLKGVNYWVNRDGSTALWNDDNSPKPAVEIIKQFYGGE